MSLSDPVPHDETLNRQSQGLSKALGISHIMVMQSDLGQLLSLIMSEANRLMNAERSSLYLLDNETGELITHVAQKAGIPEIRLPLGKGVAGYVAQTGVLMNIPEAYDCERFDRSWDEKTGFRTRNILCVPMYNPDGKVVGVLQVLNKQGGAFTAADEGTLNLFASMAAISIENLCLHNDLKLVFRSSIRALARAVDSRDRVTAGHSERVTYYAVKTAEAMGMPTADINALEIAATLHDVGKIGIPDDVLNKPGKLTDQEFDIIKSHAAMSRDILSEIYFTGESADVPLIAGAHHERLDGSGYPDGLRAEDLPLAVRILGVVDTYDALTSFDRPYRKAMSPEEALDILREEAGSRLDEEVIRVFIDKKIYKIDLRRHVRINVGLSVDYLILTRDRLEESLPTRSGQTRDISGSGLQFVDQEFVPVGTFLDMDLHVRGRKVALKGRVVRAERVDRSRDFSMGVSFVDMTSVEQDLLQEFLVVLPTSL